MMPKIRAAIFVLLALLLFSAARVDIMDIDASQYAEMSREMMQNGDYLHIYDRGNNYLDKPPMLFWLSATGMKLFGVGNFGYKFFSIVFALLALYATYRLARLLYDEATGKMAALILGCCQGMFLMTNDVRCDTVLMSYTIMAIWLIKEWEVRRRWYYLIAGAAAIAGGMMTKGPIALMVPAFAFGSDWVLKRQWKQILRPQYLLALAVVALLLIPMSIGLYQQYDQHPLKWVDGRQGVSGLRFFYWTQSFGRITGESSWSNGADLSFLLVNMLWSFLPWIFLFLPALWLSVRTLILQRFRLQPEQEWVSSGGFILAYLALGMSHYQLPHYIFVAFPLAAIMCASLLRDFYQLRRYPKLARAMNVTFITVGALLFVAALLLLTVTFYAGWIWLLVFAAGVAVWLAVVLHKRLQHKILWVGFATAFIINIFLTHHFYYRLMSYQVGAVAGKFIREHKIPSRHVMAYRMHDPLNSLHFYAQQVIRIFPNGYLPAVAGDYILTQDDGLADLRQRGLKLAVRLQGELFKVSELTPDFLSSASRHKAVKKYYLLEVMP